MNLLERIREQFRAEGVGSDEDIDTILNTMTVKDLLEVLVYMEEEIAK